MLRGCRLGGGQNWNLNESDSVHKYVFATSTYVYESSCKALGILLRTEGDMTIRKLTDFLNKESHVHK